MGERMRECLCPSPTACAAHPTRQRLPVMSYSQPRISWCGIEGGAPGPDQPSGCTTEGKDNQSRPQPKGPQADEGMRYWLLPCVSQSLKMCFRAALNPCLAFHIRLLLTTAGFILCKYAAQLVVSPLSLDHWLGGFLAGRNITCLATRTEAQGNSRVHFLFLAILF